VDLWHLEVGPSARGKGYSSSFACVRGCERSQLEGRKWISAGIVKLELKFVAKFERTHRIPDHAGQPSIGQRAEPLSSRPAENLGRGDPAGRVAGRAEGGAGAVRPEERSGSGGGVGPVTAAQ
jgi:hypothetical protein